MHEVSRVEADPIPFTRKQNRTLDEVIAEQEEVVRKAREKYDRDVQKLKDLYTKRDEAKRKALLDAIEKSNRSYEEIMAFLTAE